MANQYKPGFIYFQSDLIGQEIAMSEKTGRVYCADGVQYSLQEIMLLNDKKAEVQWGSHLVKKIFGGEVVDVKRNIRGDGKAKPVESGKGNGALDDSNPGEKIPGIDGDGKPDQNGELDLY
jgi:hypothetical protein